VIIAVTNEYVCIRLSLIFDDAGTRSNLIKKTFSAQLTLAADFFNYSNIFILKKRQIRYLDALKAF